MTYIPGTHLHVAIAVIIVIEVIIFYNQLLSYLARPKEKRRLWHLIMLGGLILTNFVEGSFQHPYPNLFIPEMFQNYLGFGFGYILAAYFPLYCYKTIQLKELKVHAVLGFCVILSSMILFWAILYPINKDVLWTRQNVFYIPAIYCGFLIIYVGICIYKNRTLLRSESRLTDAILIYCSLVPWISAPLLGAFAGQPQWVIDIALNAGFLVFNVFFSSQTIKRSKFEQQNLHELNTGLNQLVVTRTQELQTAMDEQQVLYLQRENTFANLIHETKTPITLIDNYLSEYIEQNGASEELAIVKRNVNKLSKDINNLFDLERMNKGLASDQQYQSMDASALLMEALQLFEPYCNRKGIHLMNSIEEDIYLYASTEAMTRIVNNLMENAIKYSNAGSNIKVSLWANEKQVLLVFADEGCGIEGIHLENIFKPYIQINNSKKNVQGMGLGLPLVRKIVTALNGDIIVESSTIQDNSGTCVTITLPRCFEKPVESIAPLLYNDTLPESETELSDYHNADKQVQILVVEDNVDQNLYLSKKLAQHYNVITAINGRQALEKIRTAAPDLIISDIMMDEMDGFQLAEALAGNRECQHIPLLFLSALNGDQDKLKGLGTGAIDYIEKPFVIEQVKLKISSILKQRAHQEHKLMLDVYDTVKQNRIKEKQKPEVESSKTTVEQNAKYYTLTKREREIAEQLMSGLSPKAIGEKSFISEKTVNTHIRNIYEKLGVNSRFEMISKLQTKKDDEI